MYQGYFFKVLHKVQVIEVLKSMGILETVSERKPGWSICLKKKGKTMVMDRAG